MMKKQKIFALSIIVIMMALIVGGTSAYFTYTGRAKNVITMSGVAIELLEDTAEVGVDGRPVPFANVNGAMPGDKISKIPKIKNVDEGEVYVRMKLTASVEYADGTSNRISPETFRFDQKKLANRLLITIPLLIAGGLLTGYALVNDNGFQVVWRYFSWSKNN